VDELDEGGAWDAVIVGGGPAGLSAALLLGRARRRVLICDSGDYRNAPSRAMHGFLSRDGIDPARFRAEAHKELATYPGVRLLQAEVMGAERGEQGFTLSLRAETQRPRSIQARSLLLATGLVDELPDLPGLPEVYGRDAWHCPYCDGFENAGRRLAIYGQGMTGVRLALELRGWSESLTLCTNGLPLAARERRHLAPLGIALREEALSGLDVAEGRLRGMRFADGGLLPVEGLFLAIPTRQRSDLGQRLGCRLTKTGSLRADKHGATEVPGLFVAGDASPGLQMAIVAAAQGSVAAFTLNNELLRQELTARRRGHSRKSTKPPRQVEHRAGAGRG
jgi:thioredoxin reductase